MPAALYHFSSDAEVERLVERFIACELSEKEWTHGAHWAGAFYIIMQRPDIDAERDMPDMIQRFNNSVGGENTDSAGYHETITQGSLVIARLFLEAQNDNPPVYEVCNRLFATKFGKSDWLFEFWTKKVLFSVKARHEWVKPNIKPLTL
ncbi:MAG: hypothetical protein HKP25_06600 [Marinicaulis sp.]|nr:hypothetical protein [Marinicaulis sp.]